MVHRICWGHLFVACGLVVGVRDVLVQTQLSRFTEERTTHYIHLHWACRRKDNWTLDKDALPAREMQHSELPTFTCKTEQNKLGWCQKEGF